MNYKEALKEIQHLLDISYANDEGVKLAWEQISEFVYSNTPNQPGTPEPKCTCVVKHAITDDEREFAKHSLHRARDGGDTIGVIMAIYSLQECPSKDDC